MTKSPTDETKIALINNNISFIMKDVGEIKQSLKEISGVFATSDDLKAAAIETQGRFERLEKNSVTTEAFDPVKRLVYGLVSLVLIAVVGAILALVINK